MDEVVDSISYSSSVFEIYSPRTVAGPEGFVRKGPARLLVVLDMAAPDLKWLESEWTYYEGMRQAGLPVDIVTSSRHLPEDLSPYIWITWGGHAQSNPTDWGGGALRLGDREISAIEIASEWTCAHKPWVLLGACQTSVDVSEIQSMDEYCGLDLAFYIAGAFGVYSTMWPVWDAMAAFGDVFLTNQIIGCGQEPPKALTIMQQRLRRGDWKAMITSDASRFPTGLQQTIRALQRVPGDAFKSIRHWGVFRSYGVSARRKYAMAQQDDSRQDLGSWECPNCGCEIRKEAEAAERLKAREGLEALGATFIDKSRCGECGFVVDTKAIYAGRYDC